MADRWDQRVCLAAAFFIADTNDEDSSVVHVVAVPEEEVKSSEQKVELICSIGGVEFAFEHTLLESFKKQIEYGDQINRFVEKVNGRLTRDLPPGTFTLGVATDAVFGQTGTKGDEAAAELATWIDANARAIAEEYQYEELASHSRALESGIEGTLWYRPGETGGALQFSRLTPDPLEELRVERTKTAYDSKLPKLAAQREKGRSRCLVLESDDTSLGDSGLIRSASRVAIEGYHDSQPEWILLVETDIEPPQWSVLAHDGEWPDFDPSQSSPIEIPEKLKQ